MRFKASPEELAGLRETIASPSLEQRARELADAAKTDANAARGLCLLQELYTNPSTASTNTDERDTMFKHVQKDARHFDIKGDLFTPAQAKEADPVQARVDRFLDDVAGKPTDATRDPEWDADNFLYRSGDAYIGGKTVEDDGVRPLKPYDFHTPGTLPPSNLNFADGDQSEGTSVGQFDAPKRAAIRLGDAYQFNVAKRAPGVSFSNIVFGEEKK